MIMLKSKVPNRLWDYRLIWICETVNISVSSSQYVSGRTTLKYIKGDITDISEYLDFTYYDWVKYHTNDGFW